MIDNDYREVDTDEKKDSSNGLVRMYDSGGDR